MNESELDSYEKELRKLKPSKTPESFMNLMAARKPSATTQSTNYPEPWRHTDWWRMRWLVPAAVGLVTVVLCTRWFASPVNNSQSAAVSTQSGTDEDGVELQRRLISEYDAVAQMPGGEPVRFRCREWTDDVFISDSANGFVLERSLPRFEIVPVRLETY